MAGYQSSNESGTQANTLGEVGTTAIELELGLVPSSSACKKSTRVLRSGTAPQQAVPFLCCLHKPEGNDELLKERVIGSDLFHRTSDYSSSDDPSVRVQVSEARRQAEPTHSVVRSDRGESSS